MTYRNNSLPMAQVRQYKRRIARVREADAKHKSIMEKICASGGITYDDLKSMEMRDKDAFITRYAGEEYKK